MKHGWTALAIIMHIIGALIFTMIGYSLPRSRQFYIVEDEETIKIYGIMDQPIIYEKEQK